MVNTYSWPQLAAFLKADEAPYVVAQPHSLEEQCVAGDHKLSGQNLLSLRLDMALSGLMTYLGEDFFCGDYFPSRLTAAADILTATKIFLQQPEPGQEQYEQRVRLLAKEAHDVLQQWSDLAALNNEQTMLIAAEAAAELT